MGKTFSNETGSKKVNLIKDATGNIRAMYVQVYKGEEQVLDSKSYKSLKMAEKWAKSKLGIVSKSSPKKINKQLPLFTENKMAKKKAVKRKSAGLKAGGKLKKGFKFAKGGKVIKVSKKPVAKKKFVESGKKGSPIVYSKKNSSSGGLYCYKLKPRKK